MLVANRIMGRYRVRVQLVQWYEVIVSARSPEDAITKAESLTPARIQARGKRVEAETGLADPDSLEQINGGE
jgi:hypothetical protein